jgi:hypothetical protein
MKTHTEQAIKEFFSSLYKPRSGHSHFEIGVKFTNYGVVVDVSQMYEYADDDGPSIAVAVLKISQFFETKDVNEGRYQTDGCETCDYGSNYEMNFMIKDDHKPWNAEECASAIKFFESKDDDAN